MDTQAKREARVNETLARVRALLPGEVREREPLGRALEALIELAREPALWGEADFPAPSVDERQARYLLSEDPDRRYALYLNVMRPGKRIPPHDHTTWACVAAVEGVEHNTLYRRLDDGSVEGRARLAVREEVELAPGKGVALLADDIHSVRIPPGGVIRHLHLYGRALETLTGRTRFDPEAGTCAPMDIGVQTRR
ncbi:cysteine dioxygenase family protein [Arhodomonas aquaeolei]|uniref:cysteine dioxygenase family protein n=1 Tax=Arhodomonas aquaeolei TaxID=2369 RepID=UPI0003828022|nr:cysteine dioxygenase family protein [Arhodomonas aquaeolei]